jgi:hypothetical protein
LIELQKLDEAAQEFREILPPRGGESRDLAACPMALGL